VTGRGDSDTQGVYRSRRDSLEEELPTACSRNLPRLPTARWRR